MEPYVTDALIRYQLPGKRTDHQTERVENNVEAAQWNRPAPPPRIYPGFDCIFLLSVVGEAAAHVGNRMLLWSREPALLMLTTSLWSDHNTLVGCHKKGAQFQPLDPAE